VQCPLPETYVVVATEIQLALLQIQINTNTVQARVHLQQLHDYATSKGFGLIARKAAEALLRLPDHHVHSQLSKGSPAALEVNLGGSSWFFRPAGKLRVVESRTMDKYHS
jgi:hypothetical protein